MTTLIRNRLRQANQGACIPRFSHIDFSKFLPSVHIAATFLRHHGIHETAGRMVPFHQICSRDLPQVLDAPSRVRDIDKDKTAMNVTISDAIQYVDAMAEITERVHNLSRLTTGPMQDKVTTEELNQLVYELFVVGQNVRNVVYCINDLLMKGDFSVAQIGAIKQAMSEQINQIQGTVVSIKAFIDARDTSPKLADLRLH